MTLDLPGTVERVRQAARSSGLDRDATERLERAARAAFEAHAGQTRRSGDPYVVHPVRVAEVVLVEWGQSDADLGAAALLHDTLEDTDLTADAIDRLAGPRVLDLVRLLTKDAPEGYPSKAERDRVYFARLLAGDPGASVVKCADRVDNLRDMAGSGWSLEKKRGYVREARESILPVARERAPAAAARLAQVADEVERALG